MGIQLMGLMKGRWERRRIIEVTQHILYTFAASTTYIHHACRSYRDSYFMQAMYSLYHIHNHVLAGTYNPPTRIILVVNSSRTKLDKRYRISNYYLEVIKTAFINAVKK
jgi:hypothetical protein